MVDKICQKLIRYNIFPEYTKIYQNTLKYTKRYKIYQNMATKFLKILPKISPKIINESPKCPSHVLNGPNKATKSPQKFHFRYITNIVTHSDPLNTIQIYVSHCQNISNSIQIFQTLSIYYTHFPKITDTILSFQILSLV